MIERKRRSQVRIEAHNPNSLSKDREVKFSGNASLPYLSCLKSKQQIFDIIAEFNRTDTTHM